jgi:membrane protein implicated in regulation of membrane protease activity
MNGAKYFSIATGLTLLALLGFILAGFFPIIVDFAFGIEAVAVILALTGVAVVSFVTVRKALEQAARRY